MGLGRIHDPRHEALPGHGAHHRPRLQLVVALCAISNSRASCRSDHQPPAAALWRGTADAPRGQTTLTITPMHAEAPIAQRVLTAVH
jgi:hypothetical protein